jgi:hypothetical protein
MVIQLARKKRNVVGVRKRDVVVDEGDLVPTPQTRQQQAEIPLRAQVAPTVSACRLKLVGEGSCWKGRVLPGLGYRDDEATRARRFGCPTRHLLERGLFAAQNDEERTEERC